jgi:hypothetical protein
MSVAIADAFRYVATSGTNAGEVDGTITAPGVGGTLTIVGGFGITLTSDTANRKITITNTGNGTGALTTITAQNSGTYYPVFTSIPGTFNPATGTYTSSTLYYESTTTPLSYNTTTGTLNVNNLVLGAAGTFSLDGVTSTGVTGTGNVVFGTSPTITSPQILTNAFVGPTASANSTRFPGALAVFSTTAAGIQQNEISNIGVMAEGVASSSNTNIWGVGFYGAGYTNGGTRSGGVVGEGHVSASADTGSAIGVRGYANDTHAGGFNIGLYGDATNGGTGNYALYLNSGGIYTANALTWTLNGNLTFSGAYTVTVPTLNLTNALGVSYGGTGITTAPTTGAIVYGASATAQGYLAGNTTTTPNFVTSTGTGSAAQAPTLTSSTGSGSVVLATSPSLTTPTLGVATATSINKITLTAVATGATITATDGTTITLPSTTGTVPLNNQTFYLGTTSIAINRTTGALSLTGITSIDGYAAGLAGGNNTTLLGSLPYQSNTNVTSLLSPNITATKNFLVMTGTGTNGAAPAWGTIAAGDLPTASNTAYGAVKYDNTTITLNGSNQLVAGSVTFGSTAVAPGSTSTSIAGLTSIDGTTGLTSAFATPNGTVALLGAATTLNIGASATSVTEGYTSTATSTHNIATGAVASGNTKTINIGTNGASGSTTAITIGSTNGTTITLNGYTPSLSYVTANLSAVGFTTANWTSLGSIQIPSAGIWRVWANLRIRVSGTSAQTEYVKCSLFSSGTSGTGELLNSGVAQERMLLEKIAAISGQSFINLLCAPEWIVNMPTGQSYPYTIYLQIQSSVADAQGLNNNDANGVPTFNAYKIAPTATSGTTVNIN